MLAFESLGGQHEAERLSRALSGYGDRVLIVVGEGLRELLRCERSPPLLLRHRLDAV